MKMYQMSDEKMASSTTKIKEGKGLNERSFIYYMEEGNNSCNN